MTTAIRRSPSGKFVSDRNPLVQYDDAYQLYYELEGFLLEHEQDKDVRKATSIALEYIINFMEPTPARLLMRMLVPAIKRNPLHSLIDVLLEWEDAEKDIEEVRGMTAELEREPDSIFWFLRFAHWRNHIAGTEEANRYLDKLRRTHGGTSNEDIPWKQIHLGTRGWRRASHVKR